VTLKLEVHEDLKWASVVAQRWIDFLDGRPAARLCLPTGETPRPLYALSSPEIDLSSATVFLLDEFDLPRGSTARCDTMLQRDLLVSLSAPPAALDHLDVNAPDKVAECARYDASISDGGLDLTLLGLGGNGHLGLNEPGSSVDSPTRVVDLARATTQAATRYDPDARPVRGMTLGMHRILESDEIWLLVTGSHKAAILERMFVGPIGSDLPASYLRNHPNVTVLADDSAAAGLQEAAASATR
jgi:glucosamine-6-phosphate deaminase